MKLTPLENWIVDRTGIEEKSRVKLEAFQLSRLIEALEYAKNNSRFYKEHLENVDINSINSFKDFEKVPFTSPQDIKDRSLDFLCVSQSAVKRIVTLNTSGTSGDEKRIYFTEEDLNYTTDFFQYGMSCLTDETDRVLVLLPSNAYGSIGYLLKKALEKSNTYCTVHGVLRDLEAVEKCIIDENINCIVGIPMQILYLSRTKKETFKRIDKVLLSTDYIPDVLVKELNDKFSCKVFNHYGTTEMGYGGGVECEVLKGCHMREGDFYFEIINPDTGEVVPDGEFGEVVFTTFHRQAMPLIRYRMGDIAAFLKEPCKCGTFLKTMHKVMGRIENKVVVNNQTIYLRELDELILKFEQVMDFKARLDYEDRLVIQITLLHDEEIDTKEEIKNKLYEKLGDKIRLNFIWEIDDRSPTITNSMIKRKIIDGRKEII